MMENNGKKKDIFFGVKQICRIFASAKQNYGLFV